MQQTYEERIGGPRAHLDRLASQALLDRDGLDKRVAEIAARQACSKPGRRSVRACPMPPGRRAARNGSSSLEAQRLRPRPSPAAEAGVSAPEGAKPMPSPSIYACAARAGRLPDEADRTSARPDLPPAAPAGAGSSRRSTPSKASRCRFLMASAHRRGAQRGCARRSARPAWPRHARGAASAGCDGRPARPDDRRRPRLEGLADWAQTGIDRAARLERAVTALPFARPVPDDFDPTSGSGYRLDPFTRGARHVYGP